MSPNQIALCIISLVLFCVAAWVKENWEFWQARKLAQKRLGEIRERTKAEEARLWQSYNDELRRKIADMKAMGDPPDMPAGKPMRWTGSSLEPIEDHAVVNEKGHETMVNLKKHGFLPVSNPLGSTAAFMRRENDIWMEANHRSFSTPFRHKKGGRRG